MVKFLQGVGLSTMGLAMVALTSPWGSAKHGSSGLPAVRLDTVVVAGGCFWSMQRPFEHMPGVVATTVGYSGGEGPNPTYAQVSTGKTGHLESVEVVFQPSVVSYNQILDRYWRNIDPLSRNGQFCDRGAEYQTAIFVSPWQTRAADSSRTAVGNELHAEVTTVIRPRMPFYPAEAYHQHFADRNPAEYNRYRIGCGRDARLRSLWGDKAEPGVPPLEGNTRPS